MRLQQKFVKFCTGANPPKNGAKKTQMMKTKIGGTHQFDPFCTSTHRLYFDLNLTATFFEQTLLRPVLLDE